jgi:osmotically-inducible protein OsmY
MRRALLVLASLALTLSACATADPRQDTRIEAEVKARLVAETSANLTRVGVLSANGVVHLSGTVASQEERTRAEDLARTVTGVRRVVNTLQVRPTGHAPAARRLVAGAAR